MYLSVGRKGLYLKDYDIGEIKDYCKHSSLQKFYKFWLSYFPSSTIKNYDTVAEVPIGM